MTVSIPDEVIVSILCNAIYHLMAHPTKMAHFVADSPLHLNITTPQQAI
jgi:hypothetical protein